jgi:NAD(P)-dependent dehydrogenase (short-subunit alcohol dehydrogenase family)
VSTGGTSGIGLAAARQFIKEGTTGVAIGRSASPSAALEKRSAQMASLAADVAKSAELILSFKRCARSKDGSPTAMVFLAECRPF